MSEPHEVYGGDDPILVALSRLEFGMQGLRIGLGADLEGLRARFERGLDALRTESGTFREHVLARLDAIREDIGVNMARVDRVADTNTDIRAELVGLRLENTALWRMVKALEARVNQIEAPHDR
jgi:hypothetical protein